jgi:UBX domain-containing protein 7
MWKKEGWTQMNPLTAEEFAEMAMDFCSRHSFSRPPQAPRPQSGAAGAAPPPPKGDVKEMSEEEQLRAAMRASLNDVTENGTQSIEIDDDDEEYDMDEDDDDEVVVVGTSRDGMMASNSKPALEEEPSAKPAAAAPLSLFDQVASIELGQEPPNGARIQFRMPDGKRQIRRFDPSTNVEMVYAFVAVSEAKYETTPGFTILKSAHQSVGSEPPSQQASPVHFFPLCAAVCTGGPHNSNL